MSRRLESVTELRSLLNRTHADFSNDSFGEADMLQICRHEFFRALLSGRIASKQDVINRMRLLRSRMDLEAPCVLVDLSLPDGTEYLSGRWHYGTDRLEVALRNFFGAEFPCDAHGACGGCAGSCASAVLPHVGRCADGG